MKTYRCEFTNGSRSEKIQANNYRDAYEKFLANQGPIQIPVSVLSDFMDVGEVFKDHINETPDQLANRQLTTARKQTAIQDAEASLSSTDMLLKQLIAEQKEANQWLRKIRWSIWSILLILVIWNLFGWRIIPIR